MHEHQREETNVQVRPPPPPVTAPSVQGALICSYRTKSGDLRICPFAAQESFCLIGFLAKDSHGKRQKITMELSVNEKKLLVLTVSCLMNIILKKDKCQCLSSE